MFIDAEIKSHPALAERTSLSNKDDGNNILGASMSDMLQLVVWMELANVRLTSRIIAWVL